MITPEENAVSIGELVRVVSRLETTVSRQSQLYVLQGVHASELANVNRRLDELAEDIAADRQDRKTMFRLILASLVLPALLLLFNVLVFTKGGLA